MFMWVQGWYINQKVKEQIYENKEKGVLIFIKDDIHNIHSKMFVTKLSQVLAKKDPENNLIKNIWICKQEYDQDSVKEFEVEDTIEILFFKNGKLINRIKGSDLKFDANKLVDKILE